MRALPILLVLASAPFLLAQEPVKPPVDENTAVPSDFVRFVKQGDGGHLDTAITTYRNDDGVEVTLLGAVHIADPSHYAALQQRFKGFEVLLYELVSPDDYRPRPGDKRNGSGSMISVLQTMLKNGLQLQFQLDAIDYTPKNFVHADMTPREFEETMGERGESLLSLMVQSMFTNMQKLRDKAEAGDDEAPASFDLVKAFRSGEGRHALRLQFAEQLEDLEAMTLGGQGGSTLLEGRNEKCLQVLQQQIAAGRKKIGIYYGAAHFTHMERRLVDDLGFHKQKQEWLLAWDCSKRADPKFDRDNYLKRQRAKADLEALAAAAKGWRADHGGELPTLQQLQQQTGLGKDPWGNDYVVQKRGALRAEVVSGGADGQVGTDDDLVEQEPRRTVDSAANLSEARAVAERKKAAVEIKQICDACAMYMMVNGTRKVPTLADLQQEDKNGHKWLDGDVKDPWGNGYVIRAGDRPGSFTVMSAGPDGKLDTDDDVDSEELGRKK